jgi:hypothetical protein
MVILSVSHGSVDGHPEFKRSHEEPVGPGDVLHGAPARLGDVGEGPGNLGLPAGGVDGGRDEIGDRPAPDEVLLEGLPVDEDGFIFDTPGQVEPVRVSLYLDGGLVEVPDLVVVGLGPEVEPPGLSLVPLASLPSLKRVNIPPSKAE